MDARQYIINEAIQEQRQIFGMENPDSQWILSSWDTWERNPFYHGPEQQHPEDDSSYEDWQSHEAWLQAMKNADIIARQNQIEEEEDNIPF